MSLEILAPCAGTVRPVTESSDDVFAQQMVGPGLLVQPDGGPQTVLSPISGKVVKAHPHAFVVLHEAGVGVLVHLGIDTVKLDGDGFDLLVRTGATVAAGDEMIRWDPSAVAARGLSAEVPVVEMDRAADSLALADLDRVSPGQALFSVPLDR